VRRDWDRNRHVHTIGADLDHRGSHGIEHDLPVEKWPVFGRSASG
jgi:hypothetical protein